MASGRPARVLPRDAVVSYAPIAMACTTARALDCDRAGGGPVACAKWPWLLREAPAPPPRLLDRVRHQIRLRHLSRRTEKAYVAWIRRYVLFHGKRHPRELGSTDVARVLTSLAGERRVSASTQNQALAALLFLYREVLGVPLAGIDAVRAKVPGRLPVVLTRDEVRAVIGRLQGVPHLMALLLYGAGLRLLECARLRIKDVDFGARQIVVPAARASGIA
jgi:integrase